MAEWPRTGTLTNLTNLALINFHRQTIIIKHITHAAVEEDDDEEADYAGDDGPGIFLVVFSIMRTIT